VTNPAPPPIHWPGRPAPALQAKQPPAPPPVRWPARSPPMRSLEAIGTAQAKPAGSSPQHPPPIARPGHSAPALQAKRPPTPPPAVHWRAEPPQRRHAGAVRTAQAKPAARTPQPPPPIAWPAQGQQHGAARRGAERAPSPAGAGRAVQRQIFKNLDQLLTAAVGAKNVPDFDDYGATVQGLIEDAGTVVPLVDAVGQANVSDTANIKPHTGNGNQRYDMVYSTNGETDKVIWSIVHELTHAYSAEHYTGPTNVSAGRQGVPGRWALNMNLPTNSSDKDFDSQAKTLENNLEDAYQVVTGDKSLGDSVQEHLKSRMNYGSYLAAYEYDTVVTDSLIYLEQQGKQGTDSYKFLIRIARELRDRRGGTLNLAARVDRNASWYEFWKW
jgi:hypothetical protein